MKTAWEATVSCQKFSFDYIVPISSNKNSDQIESQIKKNPNSHAHVTYQQTIYSLNIM